MGKYSTIPLSPHKARVEHCCSKCKKFIRKGETVYYRKDRFLQTFDKNKFCEDCFNKKGNLSSRAPTHLNT